VGGRHKSRSRKGDRADPGCSRARVGRLGEGTEIVCVGEGGCEELGVGGKRLVSCAMAFVWLCV